MTIQQYPAPEAAGVPSGNTANRPAAPVIGDVYYNGQLGYLEIYDGTDWIPASAPPGRPTISVVDVGTSVAYGSAQATVTFTEAAGAPVTGFIANASTGGYSATTTGTTTTITVGNNGSYTFTGTAFNDFGSGISGPTSTATLTTVPEAPTIGTATASTTAANIAVTWTLGNNGGKNLSAITITPYLDGVAQTPTTAATTTATSATISGLTGNSVYTFKVKATNANGTGLESSASNSATFPNSLVVGYLVIAGGGGGGGNDPNGNQNSGGGGAGGYRTNISGQRSGADSNPEGSISLTVGTTYTITVGAGGAGAVKATSLQGTDGANSVISGTGITTITSTGGGGGSGQSGGGGRVGGSGGGGGTGGLSAAGTANQGGAGNNSPGYGGHGGGGGGSAGGGNIESRNGGSGTSSNITGTAVTRAGGGGGSASNGGQGAPGAGAAGGGDGQNDTQTATINATANTGSGGGGGYASAGGNGGSGIVIIRAEGPAVSTTGSPTYTTSGSYHIYQFTASGSITY